MQKVPGIYVVVIDKTNDGLMEVMSGHELYRQLNRGHYKYIIGLADNRDDAFECVGYITQNAMDLYDSIDKDILYKEYKII